MIKFSLFQWSLLKVAPLNENLLWSAQFFYFLFLLFINVMAPQVITDTYVIIGFWLMTSMVE